MAGQPQGISAYEVDAAGVGQRLDQFLAARAGGVSRAKIQKLVAAGAVARNGKPARTKDLLALGDRVDVVWPPPPPSSLTPVAMELVILYEDEQVIVLDKPAGLAVHPGAGAPAPTLVQGLLHHCGQLGAAAGGRADPTAWARPGIVHRLDKDTSGVLVCAKTDRAHAALAKQFHDKTKLRREYVVLLDGTLPAAELVHESYLHRDPVHRLRFASVPKAETKGPRPVGCRYARSRFVREVEYGHRLTRAAVRLFTGRTHQIRVHAVDLGCPVVGDQLYHRAVQLPLTFAPEVRAALQGVRRQLLHARYLGFTHPTSGEELLIEAPIPEDFMSILNILEPYAKAGL